MGDPTFFATPALWRRWLARHHARRQELWVGYYKKDSGIPGITWPESVDQGVLAVAPPGYRRTATFWVMSAKREATRKRRMATLIKDSAAGQRVAPLRRP